MNTLLLPTAATTATSSKARDLSTASVLQRAAQLLEQALTTRTHAEYQEAGRLARMMDDPAGKAFTLAMVDEVFRSSNSRQRAKLFRRLLQDYGVPRYLSWTDRLLMRAGATAAAVLPSVVMPLIEQRLRQDSSRVVLDAEPQPLHRYLHDRTNNGFRINLNQLGEAVLGEQEARHRLDKVLTHLADPQVKYISVKMSAIFSQINLVAWEETLAEAAQRVRLLYRAAMREKKFVNLDMEEYRDLALTLTVFRTVLDEPEFRQLSAGIVLQAYLPDSWAAQQELTQWAQARVARGGAPIKVRLVKGANLAMEAVEAELHGWNPAPYPTKADTDANFRRMLEFGTRPENASVVRLGVATHNLFDAALTLELRELHGTEQFVELEMLEGMANHQARALRDAANGVLLYAPVVEQHDFLGALAYLVRRLDENTSPDNFLRVGFNIRPGTADWERERQRFEHGWANRLTVSDASRRAKPAIDAESAHRFENEPDTDWTQNKHRRALSLACADWVAEPLDPLPTVDRLMDTAVHAQPAWAALGLEHRASRLRVAAQVMASDRFRTLACMRHEAKKTPAEADAEVSEAIDFARYYAGTHEVPAGVQAEALGVVVIASPWNFPYAIPAGGVFAALIAGNSVILKPAPETVQPAALLARQLWDAGIPRDVLQFYPCADGETGRKLITDPRTSAVVLTGGWETARMFQSWRPNLRLYAETSGKNALIITAQADRELAAKDLVRSAFGHAGQKCSAASLGIIQADVYDDPIFRRQLVDAASSLAVGQATDPKSVVTPIIRPPAGPLHRALTQLEPGEEWLLEPRQIGPDPSLWTPGIKLGVKPGSWFHQTECFGPVLGLMRAESLAQALEWQNATEFGLTAGLHSLDPAEQAWWKERVQAGNLYINRPTTGAIVQRQPFGGWKRSSIGPGSKAGGPNYTFLFAELSDQHPATLAEVESSYRQAWNDHFALEHDPSALRSESNIFRYRPSTGVILRLLVASEEVIARAKLAAQLTGVPLTISVSTSESDEEFIKRLGHQRSQAEVLRTIGGVPSKVLQAAHSLGYKWISAPITANGRIELRCWLREQSVTVTQHRYGQIPSWKPVSRGG